MASEPPPDPASPPVPKTGRRRGRPPTGPTRNKGGRPTWFDRATGERIIKRVKKTAPLADCAAREGVTKQTIDNWIARGERDALEGKATDFAWFFAEITKARAIGRLRLFEGAVDIAVKNKDARLMIQLAERDAPELYVPPHRLRSERGDPDMPPPPVVTGGVAPPTPKVFLPAELESDEDEDPEGSDG